MNQSSELHLGLPPGDAVSRVRQALAAVGAVKTETSDHMEGRVRFGLQSVRVRVSWIQEGDGTRVILQGSSDDVWGAAAKSALTRLEAAIRNADVPGYQVDRLGMHPWALAGILTGLVLLIWFLSTRIL